MIMQLLILILVLALVLYVIETLVSDAQLKNIFRVVVAVAVIIYLLRLLGVWL